MTQRYGHGRHHDDDASDVVQRRPAPGKSTRTEHLPPVQMKGGASTDADVQARAAEGVAGGGERLPFLDVIQRSFGSHDVGDTRAHTGEAASAAARDIGANAYAMGNDVAFAGSPDLHTAAHEAAHVVQQRAGVHLKGGVGQAGDRYEQHADRVADLVVQGKSAEGALDEMSGRGSAATTAVQKDEGEFDPRPKKKVGGGSMARLKLAQDAIDYTKTVFSQGAGNQWEAIKATNANSTFRMQVMRDQNNEYWEISPSIYRLINANYSAFVAAKGELMEGGAGGNCGEHADVAFDYLCATTGGENITKAQKKDFDHAFVLIGDLGSDTDAQIVCSDPWPTAPVATLWEDHFAFTSDRAKVLRHATGTASGATAKNAIKAGLKLNARGRQMLNAKLSDEETDKLLKEGRQGDHPWIWNHPTTPARGRDYNYVE